MGRGGTVSTSVRLLGEPSDDASGTTPETVAPHAAGTLHHICVITVKLRTGPLSEPEDLAAGGFVRLPGDVKGVATAPRENG